MIILQTKKHTYQRVYWYVVCLMVLVCTSFSHALSATYAPNMGSQGITVHNNHHLAQVDNVFDVPFAQNNESDNPLLNSPLLHNWDPQCSIQLSNNSSSLSPIVLSFNTSPIYTELPSVNSLHLNNLNNNESFNDYSTIVWEEPTIRFKPSPCSMQQPITPLHSLDLNHKPNYAQQRNSGPTNEQYELSSNNSPAHFKPSPCSMQQLITPFHSLDLNHKPNYAQQRNSGPTNEQYELSSNNSPAHFKPSPCSMQQPITPLHSLDLNHKPNYAQQRNSGPTNEQYELSSNNSPAHFKPSLCSMQQLITPLHSLDLNHKPNYAQQRNSGPTNEQYELSSNNSPAHFKPSPCSMQQPITPLHSLDLNHKPNYAQQRNSGPTNEQYELSSNNSPAHFKPSPCSMQQPITPLHSLDLNHKPNYAQQRNSGPTNEQYELSSNNSPAHFKPSPCSMQQLITPFHSLDLNHNSLIKNKLNSDQKFNISLSLLLGQKNHSILLQGKRILSSPLPSKLTNSILTVNSSSKAKISNMSPRLLEHLSPEKTNQNDNNNRIFSISVNSSLGSASPILFREVSRDALKDRKSKKEDHITEKLSKSVPMTLFAPRINRKK